MDSSVVAIMLLLSVLMGAFGLFGVIWGIKNRQFEDYRKFLDGTKFDDEDALNDAYELEKRKNDAINRLKMCCGGSKNLDDIGIKDVAKMAQNSDINDNSNANKNDDKSVLKIDKGYMPPD
ncbi:cbb3-type cytochrome oxidase assembly protein CcoS [Campylobacter sp. faydin G-140]|nr:cbb3-type cytochrome oxidase assembly protein CcoS [Campylobacter anatolicus]